MVNAQHVHCGTCYCCGGPAAIGVSVESTLPDNKPATLTLCKVHADELAAAIDQPGGETEPHLYPKRS